MATFVQRNGRWMAKVCLRPFKPKAKTFASRREAEEWASDLETQLRDMRRAPSKAIELISRLPANPPPAEEVLSLPRIDLRDGPTGIYFLFKRDKCIYIGQSRRIHQRVQEHRFAPRHKKDFDSYTWVLCTPEELDELERFYINAVKPELNITFTGRNSEIARRRIAASRGKRLL